MRLAIVLALISGSALAQGRVYDRTCEVVSRRSSRGGVACGSVSYAQFEFAPADGAGMGAACACTTPTAATGEAMTFSRASVAWCTKGNETSGIANGDLVECASGQPRVMPGGDGTGGLGLSVWGERTNSALRSQEFDNAAWVLLGVTAAAPTRTANYATAPDGTATAERLQFVATASAEGSVVYQTVGGGGVANSIGVYLKGASSAGTVDVCSSDGIAYSCTACTFVAATWTRCLRENTVVAAGVDLIIGNASWRNGGTTRVANDVLVWQADQQVGATMGPPITTTSAAATRVIEVANFPAVTGLDLSGSTAATVLIDEGNATSGVPIIITATAGSNARPIYNAGVSQQIRILTGATSVTLATGQNFSPLTPRRLWSSWAGATSTITDATVAMTATGTFTSPLANTSLHLGSYPSTAQSLNGVIKRVCADSVSTRCR